MNERLQRRTDRVIWLATIAFMALACHEVLAAGPTTPNSPSLETYRNECGACHIAYPPRLLPASSWQALLSGLDKHFGVDASLDAPAARTIATFLAQNAGPERGQPRSASAPPPRITDSGWFRHEHDEISPSVWRRKSIGSPANCAACHADAAQGRFNEHSVHIPNQESAP